MYGVARPSPLTSVALEPVTLEEGLSPLAVTPPSPAPPPGAPRPVSGVCRLAGSYKGNYVILCLAAFI